MSGTGNLARVVARYGVRYGPLMFEAIRRGREPAQRAVERAIARRRDRRRAVQHAASVLRGSTLRIFHGGEPAWVVFSGDTPVVSYPDLGDDLAAALEHVDLSQREPVGPEALRALPDRVIDQMPGPVRSAARRARGKPDHPDQQSPSA